MKSRILAALILIVILVICVANQAAAAPVPPAFKQAQEREAFVRVYAQTALCMHRATLAVMRNGGGKAFAYKFVGQTCGLTLMQFLTSISGWSPEDAALLVAILSTREVDLTFTSL